MRPGVRGSANAGRLPGCAHCGLGACDPKGSLQPLGGVLGPLWGHPGLAAQLCDGAETTLRPAQAPGFPPHGDMGVTCLSLRIKHDSREAIFGHYDPGGIVLVKQHWPGGWTGSALLPTPGLSTSRPKALSPSLCKKLSPDATGLCRVPRRASRAFNNPPCAPTGHPASCWPLYRHPTSWPPPSGWQSCHRCPPAPISPHLELRAPLSVGKGPGQEMSHHGVFTVGDSRSWQLRSRGVFTFKMGSVIPGSQQQRGENPLRGPLPRRSLMGAHDSP